MVKFSNYNMELVKNLKDKVTKINRQGKWKICPQLLDTYKLFYGIDFTKLKCYIKIANTYIRREL